MISITVKDIIEAAGGELLSGDPGEVARGFSIDSRTVQPGEFFIAIKGKNYDSHDFLPEAIERGARGVIVDRRQADNLKSTEINVILVDDTSGAMGMIAGRVRDLSKIPVIAITGTNGKTSVKDMLGHILSDKYKVLKSKKSYNNIIGLSLTFFDMDDTHDIAVVEIGTNHPGEVAQLSGIARPNAVIITNIGDGHLEALGDREKVFREKIRILDFLSPAGIAFMNKDDEFLKSVSSSDNTIKFYGTSSDSDYTVTNIKKKKNGFKFFLNAKEFFLPLEGEHNISNAAAAIAVSSHFGVNSRSIKRRLEEVSLPTGRLEKVNIDGFIFINDSYNANPSSFECALRVLEDSKDGKVKGVVAGDMMELGERSGEFHRLLGESIASRGIDFLVAIGERREEIATGAISGGMQENRIFLGETHEDAADMVRHVAGSGGAVVLLKGSRAAKMEEVLRCFTISSTR